MRCLTCWCILIQDFGVGCNFIGDGGVSRKGLGHGNFRNSINDLYGYGHGTEGEEYVLGIVAIAMPHETTFDPTFGGGEGGGGYYRGIIEGEQKGRYYNS